MGRNGLKISNVKNRLGAIKGRPPGGNIDARQAINRNRRSLNLSVTTLNRSPGGIRQRPLSAGKNLKITKNGIITKRIANKSNAGRKKAINTKTTPFANFTIVSRNNNARPLAIRKTIRNSQPKKLNAIGGNGIAAGNLMIQIRNNQSPALGKTIRNGNEALKRKQVISHRSHVQNLIKTARTRIRNTSMTGNIGAVRGIVRTKRPLSITPKPVVMYEEEIEQGEDGDDEPEIIEKKMPIITIHQKPKQPPVVVKSSGPLRSTALSGRLGTKPTPSSTSGPTKPPVGFKILLTNLSETVTAEDVKELCESVGALSGTPRMVGQSGRAEAVFLNRAAALRAIQEFDKRELDGVPMSLKLVNNGTAAVTGGAGGSSAATFQSKNSLKNSSLSAASAGSVANNHSSSAGASSSSTSNVRSSKQLKSEPMSETEEEDMDTNEGFDWDKEKLKRLMSEKRDLSEAPAPDRNLIAAALFNGANNNNPKDTSNVTFTVKI